MPLLTMTACAKESATSTDNSGIPQTRSNLSDDERQQLDDFLAQQKENMQFIEGGSYEMGDFGSKVTINDGGPIRSESDNKPLHKVTLNSFSMNAYKATYGDFDVYSMATEQAKVGMQKYNIKVRFDDAAAGINWQTAQNYCQWLGQQLEIPMSLPSEAQWEYAARNRGKYVLFPTDNGHIDGGRNIWTFDEKSKLSRKYQTSLAITTVGLYPPNPLGLYDMTNQNLEWMSDWYSEDYYASSPEHNPQGPKTGTEKVVRSVNADWGSAQNILANGSITLMRIKRLPTTPIDDSEKKEHEGKSNLDYSTSARCVANSQQAIS
ncbi:formylglycine-generating enzyme family protein [Psychrobacter sp. AOP22-C1-22]|uniref:formylglycine-generating enzyme family protein n=1 Tax=unclassified Psychrobacter TaxID=196806 RepID=UPI001787E4BD|nr:SUMF1/EgtB/PvdO family nonheme iron enzyme [Psychrobacter sp. FME6]MBE0407712.1 SUMF1/EgtB/PvdO family nonheme iron enzyme [Psychrobacter sp. FME6]